MGAKRSENIKTHPIRVRKNAFLALSYFAAAAKDTTPDKYKLVIYIRLLWQFILYYHDNIQSRKCQVFFSA